MGDRAFFVLSGGDDDRLRLIEHSMKTERGKGKITIVVEAKDWGSAGYAMECLDAVAKAQRAGAPAKPGKGE
jgi:hypothetical protein